MKVVHRSILYNGLAQIPLALVGLLAVRFVFRGLGADQLGLIYLALTVGTVLSAAIELGVCATTTREVARNFKNDIPYVCRLVRTASFFYWSAYFVFVGVLFVAAPWIVRNWINLESLEPSSAALMIRILSGGILLSLPRSLYNSVIRGIQRMEFNAMIDVGSAVLLHVGTIGVIVLQGGERAIAAWYAFSFFVSTMAYLTVLPRFLPWKALIPRIHGDVVKRNLGYASRAMTVTVASALQGQADRLIISRMLPLGALGFYSFGQSMLARVLNLASAVSVAVFPHFASAAPEDDPRSLRTGYMSFQDLVSIGTLPLFAAVPFFAVPVFGYVFDQSVAQEMFTPMCLLAFGFYLNALLLVPYAMAQAVGKPGIVARSQLTALLICVPLSVLLVFMAGLTGAAAAWIFYQLVGLSFAMPRIFRACLASSPKIWYVHEAQVIAIAALTYGTAFVLLQAVDGGEILGGVLYLLATVAFLAWLLRSMSRASAGRIVAKAWRVLRSDSLITV